MTLSRSDLPAILLFCLMTPASGFTSPGKQLPVPASSSKPARREANPKAAAEFRKSQEAFHNGKLDKAIQHLRNGIALDPSNTDAYNDLGVIYANSNEFEKAIEAFGAMIEIDARCFRGYVNLAYVFNAQQRYGEAERAARQAVDLRRMDPKARYLLGVSLAAQKKNLEEALENLKVSAAEFPDAHLQMSRILIEKGDFDEAMRELQIFTKTSKLTSSRADQLLAK